VTKVRGIFLPDKGKLKPVNEVAAAAGVRITAPELKEVVSGMPLAVAKDIEKAKQEVQEEVEEVITEVDKRGVVIKADSLGSLEALIKLLKEKSIPVKKASVGEITKKDIADASADEEPLNKVLLGFNVKEANAEGVKVITHDIIYRIIEDYEKWVKAEKKKQEAKAIEKLTKPAKIKILRGCIFRQSNPAVVGVEVLGGTLRPDADLIKMDGSRAGTIKTIEMESKPVEKAEKGKEAAISLPGITAKRQVDEEDVLIVDIPESEFKELKKHKKFLNQEEIGLLKELAEIKRKENRFWGV